MTTHLVRRGELTITYPEDEGRDDGKRGGEKRGETYGVGARLDVPAGKVHEVWMGNDGCEYVIGE